MHWIASSEKDSTSAALEMRLWDAAYQFHPSSGLKGQKSANDNGKTIYALNSFSV
jgi:hypothetical protein